MHTKGPGRTSLTAGLQLLLCILLLAAAGASLGDSRSMRFSQLSRADGLSQSFVYAMVQDRSGFMWLGTQEGLNRFDGQEFTILARDPSMPGSLVDDGIRSLLLDSRGTLWIGTDAGGLSRYDPVTESVVNYVHDLNDPGSLADNRVRTIVEDSVGKLWVGTDGSGVDRFDPATGTFEHFPHDPLDTNTLSGAHVWSIVQRSDGTLWIGTDKGVSRFDSTNRAFVNFHHDPDDSASLSDSTIRVLFEDSKGTLWVGTEAGGLNRLVRETGEFERFVHDAEDSTSIAANQINAIFEDSSGVLWIGTPEGLHAWNPQTQGFTRYQHDARDPASLANDNVLSIFEDRSGVLWIGTYDGVSLWNPDTRAMLHYQQDPEDELSLASNVVTSFAETSNNEIWVGTFGGGVSVLDPDTGEFDRIRHDPSNTNSLSSDRVMYLLAEASGTVWAGTRNAGLNRIDGNEVQRFVHDPQDAESISSNGISFMLEDRQGDGIWVATFGGGLNYFDRSTGTFRNWRHDPNDPASISNDRILALFEDSAGTLWIGTFGGGLNRYDRQTDSFAAIVADPQRPDGLGGNEIYMIEEGPTGDLWIASEGGGLNRWRKQEREQGELSFEHFSEIDGLPSATIYSGVWDEDGYLWMSTGHGITRLDTRSMTFRNYDRNFGLQGHEFNFAAGFRSDDGTLYFGGLNGFNAFKPSELVAKRLPPQVAIKSLRSLDEHVDLSTFRRDGAPVSLRHNDYFLVFDYAALEFASPDSIRYSYQLLGLDDDWIDAGQQRRASYTNLEPGQYTFRVRARNGLGEWSAEAAHVAFRIAAAPWATPWAYALYVIVAVLLGIWTLWAFRQRTIRLIAQRYAAELEQVESRLNDAQRIARLGNWDWNADTGACWWSDELFSLLGLDKENNPSTLEMLLNRIHFDDRDRVAAAIDKAVETGDPFHIVHRIIGSDGHERVVSLMAEVVTDQENGTSSLAGTLHDITDRKKAEDEVRRLASFQELLARLSTGLVQGNPEQIERQVRKALMMTGNFYDVDAVSVWWLGNDRRSMSRSFRWSRANGRDLEDAYDNTQFEYVVTKLSAGETIVIDDVDAIPEEYEHYRRMLSARGTRSILVSPILPDGESVGCIVFACYRQKRSWSERHIGELTLISETLGNALIRLRDIVEMNRLKSKLQEENHYLRSEAMLTHKFDEIVGQSDGLRQCLRMVEKVGPTDASVLVLGESGTGKELIARATHNLSPRRDRPLISVNCPALASTLIESELFGHEKGAFTGANSVRHGRFELADNGTLFLDEIGELSLDLQAKLLRVLQSGEFERLGSTRTRVVNVRIIAATNRNLRESIAKGEFREDLYYRISSFPIELPPLRERAEDIPLLAEHFVRKHAGRLNKSITELSSQMIKELTSYSWPGNIRELESVIIRCLIASGDSPVLRLMGPLDSERLVVPPGREPDGEPGGERSRILTALQQCDWKIAGANGAAERLGLPPSTLRSRMQKLGIKRQREQDSSW